jgi:hypothetical protein
VATRVGHADSIDRFARVMVIDDGWLVHHCPMLRSEASLAASH